MSQERRVSRRTSLKSLGAMSAAVALAGPAAAAHHVAGAGVEAGSQDKPTGTVADVAASRFMKGHS